VPAVLITLDSDASKLSTLGTNQHHIRNVDRRFELDTPGVYRSVPGLHLFLVLDTHIHTLHHHTAYLGVDIDDFATFAFVFETAAYNLDGIAFTNFDLHAHAPTLA
jgi:hypothetical protein